MTYISKKEKVFALPDQDEGSSSSLIKASDHGLKVFSSISERGPGTLEDCQKYQICSSVTSKTPGALKSTGFKYIPIDVLLAILMSEKDAYIQELIERQDKCTCGERLFKASKFEDSEDDKEALIRKDAEVIALKNRIAGLETELEECRDTLAKAVHKLENAEDILNENIFLKEKLKRAEEIQLLEGSKVDSIHEDHDESISARSSKKDDYDHLQLLYAERDTLKREIQIMEKELIQAKANAENIDMLKRQSETLILSLEKTSKANEYYKKKLEGMKNLEKHIEELKKEAQCLTEKYKQELLKSQGQIKQINSCNKELKMLREEKEMLQKKVQELSSFEAEYYFLKKKLSQFEQIIDENEVLNSKISHLDKLESDNERLKFEMERLKSADMEARETKKKLAQLQCLFDDQEEEIKDLLSQIKLLSKEYIEEKELIQLKNEIQHKNEIINQCEMELKEIPILHDQLNYLQSKLNECSGKFSSDKNPVRQLHDDLENHKHGYILPKEISSTDISAERICVGTKYEEKVSFIEKSAVIQELVRENCSVIELSNAKANEYILNSSNICTKYKDAETSTFTDKEHPDHSSKTELVEDNLSDQSFQAPKFQEVLNLKNEKIKILEEEILDLRNNMSSCEMCKDLQNIIRKLHNDVETLQENNQQLQNQLTSRIEENIRTENLENALKSQKKACELFKKLEKEAESRLLAEIINRQMTAALSKLLKEESLLSKRELTINYLTEIESLKNEIDFLKTLVDEFRNENHILQKMKIFEVRTEKKSLESVFSKVRSELMTYQITSKPELKAEYEALQEEVKCLLSEINYLLEEADNLKVVLDAESKSKDFLQNELNVIQKELSHFTKMPNKNEPRKMENAATMTMDFEDQSEKIRETLNEIKLLKEENKEFVREISVLQAQCKDFQDEVTSLHDNMDELDRSVREERNNTIRQKKEIDSLNERIKAYEKEVIDLKAVSEEFNQKSIAFREELTAKEAEVNRSKKELIHMKNEMVKLSSEIEKSKTRLENSAKKGAGDEEDEKNDIQESADAIIKMEMEFEELRKKLEGCKTTEEKLEVLRAKRDNLIVKVNSFESEVDFLKKKVLECDIMKTELEQLKAEKKVLSDRQMNMESEEKLLSGIFELREQLRLQQHEIEHARLENANLKDQLHDLGNLLEICKKLHKTSNGQTKLDVGTMVSQEKESKVTSSTSCDKLSDTISVEEFKTELAKVESRHKIKLQKLKEGNAETIKRLVDQYEKEHENRNKAYNDSLNTIKYNYESDIRKLVEKHKSSILRLQNLHEDEVQELNRNYETQMEEMQKLNENVVNDLTSGAVEKCKLTEQFNKEIKDIELKFQRLLKEKENDHRIEVEVLQERLTRNIDDLKDLHKHDLDNLRRLYEENIVKLEEKHNRELRKCKRNNLKKTDMMRHKYEDLLTEERKKYEEQLQIMLDRYKLGDQGDQLQEDLKFIYLKEKSMRSSEAMLEFNKILQKIITHGLESIQFEELIVVHCKTCFAAENFYEGLNMSSEEADDLAKKECPHMPLVRAEKEELLKKIFILEHEIAIKQLEMHEAIINMETAEKCRMDELNTLLSNEREKNAELKYLLSNQTRTQNDLKIESYMLDRQVSLHETNFIEKVKELEVEKSENRRLEEELEREVNNSKRLNLMLENERQRFKSQRKKDSAYIQAMRMRLEEALNHEQIMESQLDYEAQFRTKLEFELQSLQRSFNLIIDQPPSPGYLESKAVKDIKNLDQFESEKEEKLCKCRNKNKPKN